MMPFIPFRAGRGCSSASTWTESSLPGGEAFRNRCGPRLDDPRKPFRPAGMVRYYQNGGNLAITPDGPRGPGTRSRWGDRTGQADRRPSLPRRLWGFLEKSLQQLGPFHPPLPFSRWCTCGESRLRSPEADRAQMEEKRLELEDRLLRITEEADSLFRNRNGSSPNREGVGGGFWAHPVFPSGLE